MKKFLLFLILLFTVFSCTNHKIDDEQIYGRDLECGVDDFYKLNEEYFGEEDTITLKLRVVYFTNGKKEKLSKKELRKRVEISNYIFLKTAKIKFEFEDVVYVENRPEEEPQALKAITQVEHFLGDTKNELRKSFKIEFYDFWNKVYGVRGYITAYIYDEGGMCNIAGIAGGIGSNYFALEVNYVNPVYHSWEHELGHCLGLLHTHQKDETNGLNNYTGDFVCDTYTSVDTLFRVIKKDCEKPHIKQIPDKYIKVLARNIMSYTRHQCRKDFTPVQSQRMRKTIETTNDLRESMKGYSTFNSRLWKKLEEAH